MALKTYDRAEWSYNHAETARHMQEGGETVTPASMLTSADNLPAHIADMRRQGYTVHAITLHTFCSACCGSGKVAKRDSHSRPRAYVWRTCPACKGHDGALTTTDYPLPDA
jgi:hypothetical protein